MHRIVRDTLAGLMVGASRVGQVLGVAAVVMPDSCEDVFETVPTTGRVALWLVCVQGLSYREAATIMGMPVDTLAETLLAARHLLCGGLAEEDAVGTCARLTEQGDALQGRNC